MSSEDEKTKKAGTPLFDRRDAVGLFGLALLGGGIGWIYPPAALIVCGGILTAVAVFGVRG